MNVQRRISVLLVLTALFAMVVGPVSAQDGDQIELTVWTNLTVEAQATVIQSQLDECLEDLPNVTVNLETIPFGNLYTRFITARQQNDLPNILNTTEGGVAFLQALDGLVPVDDIIDTLGRDDFIPSFLQSVSTDGQVWAVPDWALHHEVWYRKDLFEQAGLEIPQSWDELLVAAEALTQDTNGDGEIDTYGFAVPLGRVWVAAQTYFQVLYSADAYIVDPETGEYRFAADRETAIEAAQFLADLYAAASPPASIEWSWADFRTAFVEGRVAMTNEWGAVVLQAAEQNPEMLDNMSIFPFPGPDADTEPAAILGGGYFYAIGQADDAEVAASKQILQCMFDVERVATRANSRPVYALPVMESAFNSETFQSNEYVQRFQPEVELIFSNIIDQWYRYGMESGLNPLTGQIEATTFVGDALQRMVLGTNTPEQAVDAIDRELQYQIALLTR